MLRKGLILQVVAVCSVAILVLSCQPAAAPAPTPGAAPKTAATGTTAKPAAAAKPVQGGTLKSFVDADPDSLDPHTASAAQSMDVTFNVFEFLAPYDSDGHLTKNGLAVDWEVAKDGLSILIKLRKGVKFHDGTDFNAQAVKFNVERVQDPKMKSTQAGYMVDIASVDVVDDYTVRFRLKNPSPSLMEGFAGRGGLMVSPTAVQKYGADFGRNPVGTGPFQFVRWERGSHIVVKRFDGYWRKDKDGNQLPYLDGIDYAVMPDMATALANLRTGALDILQRGVTSAELPAIKGSPELTTLERASTVISGIYLLVSKPPFNNKALRQAVAWAIDREPIVMGPWGGKARAFTNYLLPSSWVYDATYKYPYLGPEVAKAKAKLAEAGYPQGLKVPFLTSNARTAVLTAEVLQQQLAKVGITLEVQTMTSAESLARVNAHDYTMATSGYSVFSDPHLVLTNRFHSTAGSRNRPDYKNPQVDALLDKAGSIYDEKERTTLYRQAGEIILEDASQIPLYTDLLSIGHNKKVKNFLQFDDRYPRFVEVWVEK